MNIPTNFMVSTFTWEMVNLLKQMMQKLEVIFALQSAIEVLQMELHMSTMEKKHEKLDSHRFSLIFGVL